MTTFVNITSRQELAVDCDIVNIKGDSIIVTVMDPKALTFLEPFGTLTKYCDGAICIAFKTAPLVCLADLPKITVKYFA